MYSVSTVFRLIQYRDSPILYQSKNCGHRIHVFSLYCISRKTVDTEYTYYSWCMTSTDIVKWRKTNDYENFEKGMIMKIMKKEGVVEKRGEEETKSMPHAPVFVCSNTSVAPLYGVYIFMISWYNFPELVILAWFAW